MTVYGYIRVSTDKQTTENQRFEIERFLENKSLSIDEWINETISGTVVFAKRKIGRTLKRLKKGDVVICSELSRLGRNILDGKEDKILRDLSNGLSVIQTARKHGVGKSTVYRFLSQLDVA